jgi:hypothetical protein
MDKNTTIVALTALIAGGFIFGSLVFHLGRAWADRIRGTGRPASEEVKALGQELGSELQAIRAEMAELSERMDFTERLLAKERELPRLARPERR